MRDKNPKITGRDAAAAYGVEPIGRCLDVRKYVHSEGEFSSIGIFTAGNCMLFAFAERIEGGKR